MKENACQVFQMAIFFFLKNIFEANALMFSLMYSPIYSPQPSSGIIYFIFVCITVRFLQGMCSPLQINHFLAD